MTYPESTLEPPRLGLGSIALLAGLLDLLNERFPLVQTYPEVLFQLRPRGIPLLLNPSVTIHLGFEVAQVSAY